MRVAIALFLVLLALGNLSGCDGQTQVAQCKADFIAEPTWGDGVITVQFSDRSTGDVTSWAWDFESDGVIDSTEQNPTHTYSTNGNYSITLTVATTECQDTLTKQGYINITGCG